MASDATLDADLALADAITASGVRRSPARDAWRQFRKNRSALAAAIWLVLIIVVAALAPMISRYSYKALEFTPLQGPSGSHWMGTDDLGRDVWSRVVYGARVSLTVGVGSQVIALVLGVTIGAAAGLARGPLGGLLMRLTDLAQALPQLLLAMLLLVVLGDSTVVLILALGLSMWPVVARITRGQVLHLQELEFVEAAYAIGSSRARTFLHHVVPNAMGPVIVQITFGISQAIFAEAFLSFIGLGPPPPNPSWGSLISDGFDYVRTSPHLLIFPGIVLFLTLLAVNFLGDGLRDAFDPEHRR